jgi:hypothetical protein
VATGGTVTDGPYPETSEVIGGFSLVDVPRNGLQLNRGLSRSSGGPGKQLDAANVRREFRAAVKAAGISGNWTPPPRIAPHVRQPDVGLGCTCGGDRPPGRSHQLADHRTGLPASHALTARKPKSRYLSHQCPTPSSFAPTRCANS